MAKPGGIMFWRRKRVQLAPDIREIARCTLRHRQREWVYRHGVVDEAIRRASNAKDQKQTIDAIESAFIDYEIGPVNIGYVA